MAACVSAFYGTRRLIQPVVDYVEPSLPQPVAPFLQVRGSAHARPPTSSAPFPATSRGRPASRRPNPCSSPSAPRSRQLLLPSMVHLPGSGNLARGRSAPPASATLQAGVLPCVHGYATSLASEAVHRPSSTRPPAPLSIRARRARSLATAHGRLCSRNSPRIRPLAAGSLLDVREPAAPLHRLRLLPATSNSSPRRPSQGQPTSRPAHARDPPRLRAGVTLPSWSRLLWALAPELGRSLLHPAGRASPGHCLQSIKMLHQLRIENIL
jgi:hypothetical protein